MAEPIKKADSRSRVLDFDTGILLDLFVLIINLLFIGLLTAQFRKVIGLANSGSRIAQYLMFAFFISIFIFPPAGAVLKRHWRFRHSKTEDPFESSNSPVGCLFNPIFYFCQAVLIFSIINAFVLQYFYPRREPPAEIFIPSVFFGLALIIAHTFFVYRYFSPPKRPPRIQFLATRNANLVGDIFIFTNMLFYQVIWGTITFDGIGRPADFWEVLGRIFFVGFVALLIYFPPRMIYLADTITQKRVWLTMLIANLPMILRLVFGLGGTEGTDIAW
jgi:hypothetical protein